MKKIVIKSDSHGLIIEGLANHPGGFRMTYYEAVAMFLQIDKWIDSYEGAALQTDEGSYEIAGLSHGILKFIIRRNDEDLNESTENEGGLFFVVFSKIMQRFYLENAKGIVKVMQSSSGRIRQVTS